ncbi:MAG: ATP-binding cassette domain-containing protein [Coriobacteriia bacterium]
MALILKGAGYAYQAGTSVEHRALADVSLEIGAGDLLAVFGPTGSGKSTLLSLMAGLVTPTEGSVSVDGLELLSREAVRFRKSVGLVFQDPESQFFADTVLADAAFGPRNRGMSEVETDAAARDALALVGLGEEFHPRSPFSLSGGEARRAAIAGVVAMRPAYLLLDEPTAGLDAPGRAAVIEIVCRARESAGVVVVSHDPDTFLPLATRVLYLRDGRPVFSGDARAYAQAPPADAPVPEVVRAQALATRHGAASGSVTFDPVEAARRLAGAAGWPR